MPAAPRIVSLVPSLTELVFELGLGPCLVGRTGFCVHPAQAVRAVPKLGGTKEVDEAALLALKPTHLIVNKDENEAPLVERLARHIPELIITHPLRVEDNHALFAQFAQVFRDIDGVAGKCARLQDELARELACNADLRAQAAPLAVRYLIWKSPWMSIADNTYIASMLASVGLHNTLPARLAAQAAAEVGASRYPVLGDEEVIAADCAHILLSSEPFRFTQRHCTQLQQQVNTAHARASDMRTDAGPISGPAKAPPGAPKVSLVDGEMCSWYGPRALPGLRYLRQLRQLCTTTPIGSSPAPLQQEQ